MIVSRPSISTTGPASESRIRKYGRRSPAFAASSCSRRSCVRAFSKTSTGARAVSVIRKSLAELSWQLAAGRPRLQAASCKLRYGAAPMALDVRPVRGWRDLRAFVALPFRLHAGTTWIPPLKLERYAFLRRRLNPYFKHGEAEYFLARRGERVVGRITAQIDHAFNEFHQVRWGMFGFLELEDDAEALDGLLAAAEGWLRARGCERMVGPMDFQMNDESGVLVE